MGDEIELGKIINNNFMRKHTSYQTIDELFNKSGFNIENEEDFNNIPEDTLDIFIKENTKFDSWEDMLGEASMEYVSEQLEF